MQDSREWVAEVSSFFSGHAADWYTRYSATGYDAWEYRTRGHIALQWLAELRQANGRRLLEIGCGAGVQSAAAARQGWEVVAVDLTQEMLAEAQHHSQAPAWIAAAVEALPFRSHAYDAVLMNGVIGYVEDPLHVLRTVREQLRPDGKFIVSWASPHPLLLEAVSQAVSAIPDAIYLELKRLVVHRATGVPLPEAGFYQQHLRRWSPEEFYALLETAGFRIDRVRSLNFGQFRFMDHPLWSERIDIQLSVWLDHLAGTAPHRHLRDGAHSHIALVAPVGV